MANFTVTCKNCLSQIELDLSNSIEHYPCLNCQQEIPLRPNSMGENVELNSHISTLYEINDDGYSKLFIGYDSDEKQMCLIRVFDKTLYTSVSSPDELKNIMEAAAVHVGSSHLPIISSAYFEEYLYQIMPYIKLESLEQIIDNAYLWSPLQALDLCYNILESLEKAYTITGSGHFNLNPHNIFITNDGEVKFIGFTLAPQLLQDTKFISSPFNIFDIYYTAPELSMGLHYPNQSSDLYSLGLCLYYMLSGLTPFGDAEDKSEIVYQDLSFPENILADFDEDFMTIFTTMTHHDRNHRYQSYKQALDAFKQYYNSCGHTQLKQMEGEKTQLFQSQHFIQHIMPILQKKPKSLKLKSKQNYNSEVIRQRISTEVRLPREFKTKIHQPRQNNNRRLVQRSNSKLLQSSTRVPHQKKTNNILVFGIALALCLLTLILCLISYSVLSAKSNDDIPSEDLTTLERNNTKVNNTAISESHPQPIKKNDKQRHIETSWYDTELDKSEPNFTQINKKIATDLSTRNLDTEKTLLLVDKLTPPVTALQDLKTLAAIPPPINEEFQLLALQLINADLSAAKMTLLDLKTENINTKLDTLMELIKDSSHEQLFKSIFIKILSSDEPIIAINYEGQLIDAELNSYNLKQGTISVKSYIKGANINLQIPYTDLDPRYLVTWLNRNDKDSETFLRFMFLIQSNDFTEAYRYLKPYNGALAKSLKPLVQKYLNSEAESTLEITLLHFHQKLGSKINPLTITSNNSFALLALIQQIKSQYSFSDFTIENQKLMDSYMAQLKSIQRENHPNTLIVGPDNQFQLPRLSISLKSPNKIIRLLPGIYTAPIIIDHANTVIIGCTGVKILSDIVVNSSSCSLDNLTMTKGNLIINENLKSINISNCDLKNGYIQIFNKSQQISINNCIIKGLITADTATKLSIQNSLLLPSESHSTVLSGSPKRTQFLNCIFSSYGPPIFSNLKRTNDIRFRYCLFSTDYHLTKSPFQTYINLDDLGPLFSDLNFCIYKKAIFINEVKGDLRLSSKSPGYLKGHKTQSIGVQMNEKQLLQL
ncbi:protein kinase [Lentisphaera profundi]|uniref:non-specific serine/threonine protein kinase n=1 Tax=Lentisphaera profundi TaxID=1658616 RepID=A0ABY7VV44_9BACT|nr:protein kinase [Lentisphaera profundi]WDE98090.1 protein kinase [Lentisphaera profundi]